MANDGGGWTLIETDELKTYGEALAEAKKLLGDKWKWNKPSGNCKSTAYLRCNKHVACDVVYKVQQVGSSFYIRVKGDHGAILNLKKRKNSKLTFEEEVAARLSLDMGCTPGEVHVALTKKKLKELKQAGKDPQQEKNKEGGLPGVCEKR